MSSLQIESDSMDIHLMEALHDLSVMPKEKLEAILQNVLLAHRDRVTDGNKSLRFITANINEPVSQGDHDTRSTGINFWVRIGGVLSGVAAVQVIAHSVKYPILTLSGQILRLLGAVTAWNAPILVGGIRKWWNITRIDGNLTTLSPEHMDRSLGSYRYLFLEGIRDRDPEKFDNFMLARRAHFQRNH